MGVLDHTVNMFSCSSARHLRIGTCHPLPEPPIPLRTGSRKPYGQRFASQYSVIHCTRRTGYNAKAQPLSSLSRFSDTRDGHWNRKTTPSRTYHRRSLSTSANQKHEQSNPSPSSVSAEEVSHFSRLASSWWDPHGPSRLLHLMNPLRHDFIKSCLISSDPQSNKKLSYLDVGCGGGIFASSAARMPATSSVTAIDPTPSCIAIAQSHQRSDPSLSSPKLTYLNCAIEDLPSSVEAVDILTVFEVLEHVESPSQFLSLCAKHIKPNGWLIGSTISRSALSYITTKLIAEAPVIGVVPRGTHDWNKYINPSELQGYFAIEGRAGETWGLFQTQGVIYLPTLGWKMVNGSEEFGNFFFGVQKLG